MFDFLDGYDVLGAFWMTVKLTVLSAVASLIWGTVLAAMRVSPVPLMRGFGTAYVNIVRNIPLTLIIVFSSLGLADIFGMTMGASDFDVQGFRLAVLSLAAYTAAFVCEAIRSGINTVPLGQAEAARAIGMTFRQTLSLIVLPQAGRAVIAPLGSIFIALTKNATIVGTIGVMEASNAMKQLINDNGNAVFTIFFVFAGTFAVVLIPTGYGFGWLANRLAVKR